MGLFSRKREPIQVRDGLESVIGGLGNPNRDKSASTTYGSETIDGTVLGHMYRSSWVAQKIVNIPAFDAFRKWRYWQGEAEQVAAIQKVESDLRLKAKVVECKIMSRLWGGAGIIIGTDQDPAEPLDPETIGKDGLKYLNVFTRHELNVESIEMNPLDPNYGRAKFYHIGTVDGEYASIHHTRVFAQRGNNRPLISASNADDWGDSILQVCYDIIRQTDGIAGNIASLVFEANVDVFGVPNFMLHLADPAYRDKVIKRFNLAARGKSINQTLIHDAEETFERKGVVFAHLPEIMEQYLIMVSGAADIPITRFLGRSPGGLSSTGDGDLANYYDKIQSIQTLEVEPEMRILNDCIIMSALGSIPDEVDYQWYPIKQVDETQIAAMAKDFAIGLNTLAKTGLFTPEELREVATNKLSEARVFPTLSSETEKTENVDFEEIKRILVEKGDGGGDDPQTRPDGSSAEIN